MTHYYAERPDVGRRSPISAPARRPVVTWTLLGVNILLWLAMEGTGSSEEPEVLRRYGAMFGPLIADGEYWRLFTAMFLHVGFMHLLFNGASLLILGRMVEQVYGHVGFAVIYVIAGLSGGVASYMFINPITTGAGASGAIFGILGALAAYLLARRGVLGEMGRQFLSWILIIAAINLIFGFAMPGIDNWAHMGGLAAGFVLGLAFAPRYIVAHSSLGGTFRRVGANPLVKKWWVIPVAAVVLVAGTGLGTASLPDNAYSRVYSAKRLIREEKFDAACDEIRQGGDLGIKTRDLEALSKVAEVLVAACQQQ